MKKLKIIKKRKPTSNFIQALHQIKLGAADGAAIRLVYPLFQALIMIGMAAGEQRNTWSRGLVVGIFEGIGNVEELLDADGAVIVVQVDEQLVKISCGTHGGDEGRNA